ncbi:MAG: mechanosensitive ion channel family protein [Allosphingosinicella sp.]|uniref:mechanosensitive ion channel family protein n=1 Tax=Allosphingosinicella sp. TaxID=2823234 RepID=UPI003929C5BB
MTAPNRAAPQPDLFANWQRLSDWAAAHYAEILTAVGIGIVISVALIGLRGLVRRMLGGTQATGWRQVAERVVSRTYLFFIVMVAAKLVSEQTLLPGRVSGTIDFLFIVAAAFQIAIWARALIIGAIEQRTGEDESGRLGTAMGLIQGLVTVAAFLIAFVVILDNVGVNVTGLIAGLGIGGIAIGLAAQGIFRDLFAALSIIFDRPFRRGDTISFGGPNGVTGTVEHIGVKTTRLRALDGELVAVGNDKLLQDRVHNYAQQHRRRVVMTIPLLPHSRPDALAGLPAEIEKIVSAEPRARFDRAHLVRLTAASVDMEVVFFTETPDARDHFQARHDIILALLRRLEELGVAFAAPPAAPAAPAA